MWTTLSAQAQGRQTVTLNFTDAGVQQVLQAIEEQTDFTFSYSPADVLDGVNKRIRIVVTNGNIDEVLKGVLSGTDLRYTRDGMKIKITSSQSDWKTIWGKVIDQYGDPLPGATVRVKGTKRGATTDTDGNYSVKVPSLEAVVLLYTFVGMQSKEVKPTSPNVNVTLEDDAQLLQGVEIESTGYQDTDKRLSTSSVVTIDAGEVLTSNVSTIDNMLMGKIPGMTVLSDVTTPGAAAKIRVRGVSTLSGSREPLWVVDGIILDDPVPLSPEEINSLDNVNLIGNAISGLNPMDIEKIDILKDAAATAIYGVRAANGVIVVTTKKGKEGRFSINYSGSLTLNQRPNYGQMNLMNSKERIDLSKEIERRNLEYPFMVSRIGYEGLLMDFYDRKLTEDQFLQQVKELEEVNTDWFGLMFQPTVQQRHNVSISGGSEKMTYYASGSFNSDPDIVKTKGVRSYSGMMKLNFKPIDKVTAQLQLRVNGNDKQYTYPTVAPYRYALETSRAIPAFDKDGERVFYNDQQGSNTPLRFNMMNELDHSGDQIKSNGYNVTAFLEYHPITDLRINTTFGLNMSNTHQKVWFDDRSFEAAKLRRVNYDDPLPQTPTYIQEQAQLPYGGKLNSRAMRNLSWQWRMQLLYNWRPWEGHTFSINTGPEFRSIQYSGINTTEFGYLPDRGESFMFIDPAKWLAYRNMVRNYPDVVTNRLSNFISVFANMTYSYLWKYVLTFNVRAEGSNKFGQDPKARFLPIWSLSGRWNIHEEDFLKEVSWINLLAVKASFGLQGNVSDEQTPNLIMRFGDFDDVSGEFPSMVSKLPNPFLRWEKNTSYNLGFESAFLSNRLTFNIDYYRRIGTDQLINKAVSHTLGKTNVQINAGTLLNQGVDFMLTAVPIRTPDWTWTLNLNGGWNENVVTDGGVNTNYTYPQYLNGSVIMNGESVNTFYSYRYKGLNAEGKPDFYGLDPDDQGGSEEEFLKKVLVKSGKRVPLAQGGIGTSLRWKDLTLNLFFSYSVGNKVRLNNLYSDSGQRTPKPQQNLSADLVDRWRNPGDEAHTDIPVVTNDPLDDVAYKPFNPLTGVGSIYKYSFAANRWQMYNKSDLRVVDGSHLRLRSASLSWMVPTELLEKTPMKSANIRLEGYNLLLIASPKLKGQDPAQITLGSRTTPPLPSYSLTVNLSF